MAEPFTESYGFTGPFPQEAWADFSALEGRYLVGDVGSWKVQAVPNQRSVTIAAGSGRCSGVFARSVAAKQFTFAAPGSGKSRWYEIARRTRWGETRQDEFVATPYPEEASTAVPTLRPDKRPNGAQTTPGVVDDQPVGYVWVRSTDNTVVVFDPRLVSGAAGPIPALAVDANGLWWFPRTSDRAEDQFAGQDYRYIVGTPELADMPRGIYSVDVTASVTANRGAVGYVRIDFGGQLRELRADTAGQWQLLTPRRRFYHPGGKLRVMVYVKYDGTNPVPTGVISNNGGGCELYLERAL